MEMHWAVGVLLLAIIGVVITFGFLLIFVVLPLVSSMLKVKLLVQSVRIAPIQSLIQEILPPASTPYGLQWFKWDSQIGEIFACAESAEMARQEVMKTVASDDASWAELAQAVSVHPISLPFQPYALVAWRKHAPSNKALLDQRPVAL